MIVLKNLIPLLKKHQTSLFRCFFITWALWLLYKGLYSLWTTQFSYYGWNISEWMINYQGGFVRRGLAGETLYQLYQLSPYPLSDAIVGITIGAFLLLMWFLIRLFKQEGWSYLFFLAPCFLVYMFVEYPIWIRRDHISLLITWLIYALYANYLQNNRKNIVSLLGLYLMSFVTLLLHEASFFYTFPILFIHHLLIQKKNYLWDHSFIKSCKLFSLPFATMLCVCIFKGNEKIADLIWKSWEPCMEAFPLHVSPYEERLNWGNGVVALTWDTIETAKMHLTMNYARNFYTTIPTFPFMVYNYLAIYYLVTRINTVDLKWNLLKSFDHIQLSNILILQGCFMLPMFTVLSCDFGRTFPYWITSTFIAFHYFKKEKSIMPKWLNKTSQYLQLKIDNYKILNNPWVYIIVLFTLPIPAAGGATLFSIEPVKILYRLLKFIEFI